MLVCRDIYLRTANYSGATLAGEDSGMVVVSNIRQVRQRLSIDAPVCAGWFDMCFFVKRARNDDILKDSFTSVSTKLVQAVWTISGSCTIR